MVDGVDGLLETALEPLALQPDEEVHVQRNHLLDPDSTAAVIYKHRGEKSVRVTVAQQISNNRQLSQIAGAIKHK